MKLLGIGVLILLGLAIVNRLFSFLSLVVVFLIVYFYLYPDSYNSVSTYVTDLYKLIPSGWIPSKIDPSKVISPLK